MANLDAPAGFSPVGDILRSVQYEAGATIYPGDAVVLGTDGQVDSATGASYTTFVVGVALNKALVGEEVRVSDHPDQRYKIQADESDINAQTDIFQNYAIVATAGDSSYESSRMELDSSTGNTTNTLPIKLLRIDARPDNELGANVDCIVQLNNNQLVADAGSLGV